MPEDKIKYFIPFCNVLMALNDYSIKKWKQLIEKSPEEYKLTLKNRDFMINGRPPLSTGLLKEIAHKSKRRPYIYIKKPWFYLPPLNGKNKEFIPVLNLDFDLRNKFYKLNYRIGMIKIYEDEENIDPKGFGFRLEIGEKNSSHEYCHAQITLDPLDTGSPLPKLPIWLPEQIPCFPLSAICPVSLFLCLLMSLYGKHIAKEIIISSGIGVEYLVPIKNILNIKK